MDPTDWNNRLAIEKRGGIEWLGYRERGKNGAVDCVNF